MESRRLFAWMAASFLLIMVVTYVRNWLNPPVPAAAATDTAPAIPGAELAPRHRDNVVLALASWGSLTPGPFLVPRFPDEVLKAWNDQAEEARQARLAEAQKRLEEEFAKHPENTLTLGGAGTKIEVVLSADTSHIKSITLNEYRGGTPDFAKPDPLQPLLLPVWENGGGSPRPLPRAGRFPRRSFRVEVPGSPVQWRLRPGHNELTAEFETELPSKNVRLIKRYHLRGDAYHLDMELRFELLDPARPGELVYELTGPCGLHVEGMMWKQMPFRQAVVGALAPDDVRRLMRHTDDPASLDPARGNRAGSLVRIFNDPKDDQVLQYAGVMSQFFAALVIVPRTPTELPARAFDKFVPSYVGDDSGFRTSQIQHQGKVGVTLVSAPIKLAAGAAQAQNFELFAGPCKVALLKYEDGVAAELPEYYTDVVHLRSLTEAPFYRWTEAIGWTAIVNFCTNLMHKLLEWLFTVLRSYGLAIVGMTVIVRLLMFPISRKQALIMQQTSSRMAALKPELDKLNEKYKNDPQLRGMAQMELFKKNGVNPFQGCTGCLVMLLQMPIFMGLYYALNESTHLRLEGFLWMSNLAAPDMLINWSNWPVIGGLSQWLRLGDFLNLLPLVSVGLMYWQQKKMMPPAMDDQQAMQQKMMSWMMFLMVYLFYWVPSGLCLYFIISGAWGVFERKFIPKVALPTPAGGTGTAAPADDKAAGPGKKRGDRHGKPDEKAPSMSGKVANLWQKLLKEAEKRR